MESVESCRRRHKENPLIIMKLGVQVNSKTNYEPDFPLYWSKYEFPY